MYTWFITDFGGHVYMTYKVVYTNTRVMSHADELGGKL